MFQPRQGIQRITFNGQPDIKSSVAFPCKLRLRVILILAGLLVMAPNFSHAFDRDKAMALVREQCAFGPRVPGTSAHAQCRIWIRQQLETLGFKVSEEKFHTTQALTGAQVDGYNIWGLPMADGATSPALVLSAHWDTRPWADQSGGKDSMLGANDGASGVAMALELARGLRQTALKDHLALAFWDVEDGGVNDRAETWAEGSRSAASHALTWTKRIALGINLDMVGGEGSQFKPEAYSLESATWAVKELWAMGRGAAPDLFLEGPVTPVVDDHLAWIQIGVPFIDLICLPWKWWHTVGDSPEHVSPQVMETVGNVLYNFLLAEPWKTRNK